MNLVVDINLFFSIVVSTQADMLHNGIAVIGSSFTLE